MNYTSFPSSPKITFSSLEQLHSKESVWEKEEAKETRSMFDLCDVSIEVDCASNCFVEWLNDTSDGGSRCCNASDATRCIRVNSRAEFRGHCYDLKLFIWVSYLQARSILAAIYFVVHLWSIAIVIDHELLSVNQLFL